MRVIRLVLAASLVILLAGEASAQGPIKIGFISPLSGAIAAAGKDMYSGCELYWQETGWQAAGRKIEVTLDVGTVGGAATIEPVSVALDAPSPALSAPVPAAKRTKRRRWLIFR